MADQNVAIPISDIADPDVIRVQLLASGRPVHAPLVAIGAAFNVIYNWATVTHAAPSKTTPVDADEFSIVDSAASNVIKKLTWANLKAAILAYFNGTAKATPVNADRVWQGDSAASNVPVYSTWTQIKSALFGTAAVKNTGTSGNTVPLLDAANTWSSGVNQAILGRLGVGPNTGTPGERLSIGYGENMDVSFGSATSMKSYLGTFQDDIVIASNRRVSDGAYAQAGFPTAQIAIRQASGDAQIKFGTSTTNGSGTATDRMNITGAGLVTVLGGCFGRAAPVTKTADFTVAATENWLINNKAAATCTVTLPAAASWTGREIMIKNLQAFTVVSASSNVVPLAGGAAAAAILSANAGRWCTLVSDGTNWVIMNGVI